MSRTRKIIENIAGQQGWTSEPQKILLCHFLDELGLDFQLEAFLKRIANEENLRSTTEDDEN